MVVVTAGHGLELYAGQAQAEELTRGLGVDDQPGQAARGAPPDRSPAWHSSRARPSPRRCDSPWPAAMPVRAQAFHAIRDSDSPGSGGRRPTNSSVPRTDSPAFSRSAAAGGRRTLALSAGRG